MRIGFFQFCPRFGRPRENAEAIAAAVREARADLIVAPELATSGYAFSGPAEAANLAEPVPGPSTLLLQTACREANCRLAFGLPERAGKEIYNSAVLVGRQGVEGVYRKAHLFSEEKLFFLPGNAGFPLFEVNAGREVRARVGLLVCFDHMFPEAARSLALQGAQIICHPSNLVLPEYGQLTTRVRSIENRVFWILANRYGREENAGKSLTFTGASQIIAPDGKILAKAPESGDALMVVEADPGLADSKKVTDRNDLFIDRRVDLYRL